MTSGVGDTVVCGMCRRLIARQNFRAHCRALHRGLIVEARGTNVLRAAVASRRAAESDAERALRVIEAEAAAARGSDAMAPGRWTPGGAFDSGRRRH